MKKTIAVVLVALLSASWGLAIDRDASMIDSVSVELATYDSVDLLMIGLWSEIALQTIDHEWAMLAAARFGQASTDSGDETETWFLGAGLKYYATACTSFSLIAGYQDVGTRQKYEVMGAQFAAKHRLVSADEVLSPFVRGTAALEDVQLDARFGADDGFTLAVGTIGFGCDVMLRTDMGISLEAGISQSISIDGDRNDYASGWMGSAAMVYYWE